MHDDHRAPSGAEYGDRQPFLSTHRAAAICAREVGRVTDGVRRGISELSIATAPGSPDVQVSPDRCVVQYGPVALTVGWLRHSPDTADTGELLVMIWRGVIARRGSFRAPERGVATTRTATVLVEHSFVAAAADEASWVWRPTAATEGGYASPALADWCVERLRLAHAEEMARVARMASA